LGLPFEIEAIMKNGIEVIFILRKSVPSSPLTAA
jgi:hypothetical protein